MNLSGIQKISIFDPTTGTTVQINNVGTDGEFKSEPMNVETSAGSKIFAGDSYLYSFECFDFTGYEQLRNWMIERTPVNFVALGIDTHIVWLEDTLINVDPKYKLKVGELNGFSVTLEKKGGLLGIYSGVNIIQAVNGWKDINYDDMADGYIFQFSDDVLLSFSNARQVIELTAGIDIEIQSSIKFPIGGAKLRFAVYSTDSQWQYPFGVTCLNFNNSILAQYTADVNNPLDFTTPAGTYKLILYVVAGLITPGDGLLDFKPPYLGITNYSGL